MSDEDCDAIAEFIRSKGITRCPTACVVPTQGAIGAADRIALEQHAARVIECTENEPLLAGDSQRRRADP
jgi:hypothetical protein